MKRGLPAVVVDTTLLRRLRELQLADRLPFIFDAVLIPDEVRSELGASPGRRRPWLRNLLRTQGDFFRRCTREDKMVREFLEVELDPGESAVLAQAFEISATAVIDEQRAWARGQAMQIDIVRTDALLLRLKEAGAIDAIRPYVRRLKNTGFFLAEAVERELLVEANELDPEE